MIRSGWQGAGETKLAFNNSELFEETPLSKADNVSDEITIVTPPQLNSSGSDNLWHCFYQYKFLLENSLSHSHRTTHRYFDSTTFT